MLRKVDVQTLCKFLEGYLGKSVELGVSPIWSIATYKSFRWQNTEDELKLYDGDFDASRQEMVIEKDQIVEIVLSEGKDIYESVVEIELVNGKIDFTISKEPTKCFKCHKIIDEPYETKWSIVGVGGYGSKFTEEKLDIPICDDCLYYKILGYIDGQFEQKEMTCH